MAISEINAHLEEIYGLTFSASQISRITEDIFTVSIDGLKGFGDAISTIFPEAQIQRRLEKYLK